MHEPVKANLEDYLAGSESLPREFTAHLLACTACREELAEFRSNSALVKALRTPAEIEPMVGFYARVMERIDAQRQSSMWSIFLEPAFGRRLAIASAVLAVLMGFYLVNSEPGIAPLVAGAPVGQTIVLPGEDEPAPVLGASDEQDRGTVLVNLATYQEQ